MQPNNPNDPKEFGAGQEYYTTPVVVEYEKSEGDDLETHVDEKWLVSYADLMTLLFGLFVMLYSMAMETQGNPNQKLKAVSESTFVDKETAPPATELSAEEVQALQQQLLALQKEKQELQAEISKLEQELEKLKELQADPNAAQKMAELELRLKDLESQLLEKDALITDLRGKLSESEKLVVELQEIKIKYEELLKQKAEKPLLSNKEIVKQKRTLASLEEQVSKLSTLSKEEALALSEKLKQLELDLAEEKRLKEEALKKLADNELKAENQFLMVVSKWSTEKHDVDMSVTDPKGRVFNYKNKKKSGAPGAFEIDSRYGPGVEMWRASQFVPGVYAVSLALYNQYGNTADALTDLNVVSNHGNTSFPQARLNLKNKKKAEFRFSVNAKGEIKVLGSQ